MNYQIKSDNIDISPSMEVLAKEKFARIESRCADVDEGSKSTKIVLNSAPEGKFEVKSEVIVNGKEYFSNSTEFTLEHALIETVDELLRMMEKDKPWEAKWKKMRDAKRNIDDGDII